jgi:hypothetical protein
MEGVLGQRLLVIEVEGRDVYGEVQSEEAETVEELPIELRDGEIVQGEREPLALARRDDQPVVQEVERDLEPDATLRDRACLQPARGNVERNVPPAVPEG